MCVGPLRVRTPAPGHRLVSCESPNNKVHHTPCSVMSTITPERGRLGRVGNYTLFPTRPLLMVSNGPDVLP